MFAAAFCNTDAVKAILEHQADVDIPDELGQTSLFYAFQHYNLDIYNYPYEIQEGEVMLYNILRYWNNEEIVSILIKYNATVDYSNKNGLTPLMYAIDLSFDSRKTEMSAELVQYMNVLEILVSHTALSPNASIDDCDEKGRTALMAASMQCHRKTVEILLKYNASINRQDDCGRTSLMLAATTCNYNSGSLKVLLKNDALKDMTDNKGQTALIISAIARRENSGKILLEFRASIDVQDKEGKTALVHAAIKTGDEYGYAARSIVEVLLKHKASVSIEDNEGKNALYYARQTFLDKYPGESIVDMLKKASGTEWTDLE